MKERMQHICTSLILCINLIILPSSIQAALFVNEKAIEKNRQLVEEGHIELKKAVNVLLSYADELMIKGPYSVVYGKKNPAGGDPHDYCSMSPYWWPDPEKPDGLPYVRKDGQVNPERLKYDKTQSSELHNTVEILTMAYLYSGDSRYAQRAEYLIRIWFLEDSTRMNPNMNYAQFVPGRSEGRSFGIIESRVFLYVLDYASILFKNNELTHDTYKGLINWAEEFLDWLMTSPHGKKERKAKNNHGSWFDVQAMGFAILTQQDNVIRDIAGNLYRSRIKKHILHDGRQPEELKRTRSFFYSGFNLNAITRIYLLAMLNFSLSDSDNEKVLSEIQHALDYLYPYAIKPESWPFKQIGSFEDGRYMLAQTLLILDPFFPDMKYNRRAAKIPLSDVNRQILILRHGIF